MQTKTLFLALFVFSHLSIVQSEEIEPTRRLKKNKSSSSKSSKVSSKASKGYKSPKLPSLSPSNFPTNFEPNERLSLEPSVLPSSYPTKSPSSSPSVQPSSLPSTEPSSEPPTASPSIDPFDLQNCNTYKLEWLFDLSNSCIDSSLSSCQCYDAKERIDNGQITCGVDMCPEDCEVCKVCLYEIECPRAPTQSPSSSPTMVGSSEPSSKPTNSPSSVPSTRPSHSPTHVTTSPHPTSLPSSEPTSVFDLDDCDAYSSSWLFEIITEGKCTSAELLVKDGVITCDSVCPENCAICQFCLGSVLTCPNPSQTVTPSASPSK